MIKRAALLRSENYAKDRQVIAQFLTATIENSFIYHGTEVHTSHQNQQTENEFFHCELFA